MQSARIRYHRHHRPALIVPGVMSASLASQNHVFWHEMRNGDHIVYTTIPDLGDQRTHQAADRSESEGGRTSVGPLCHLLSIWPAALTGRPTQRLHLQEQTQDGHGSHLHGPQVSPTHHPKSLCTIWAWISIHKWNYIHNIHAINSDSPSLVSKQSPSWILIQFPRLFQGQIAVWVLWQRATWTRWIWLDSSRWFELLCSCSPRMWVHCILWRCLFNSRHKLKELLIWCLLAL